MEKLVAKLRSEYPTLSFVAADIASWSPEHKRVSYSLEEGATGVWSLLHELGHALLGHSSFETDIALLRKEVAAWEEAKLLAAKHSISIGQEHIDGCLDSYRDWLHKRSTCPSCGSHGVQQIEGAYGCLNCQGTWKVTNERFCRPYRLKSAQAAI